MDACIVLGVASLAIALLLGSSAFAQTRAAPTNTVVTINTGNKFQVVLASSGTARRMLRISNNNTNRDSCWVFVGNGQASKEGSYAVPPGKEYLRYPPFVPSDATQATCVTQFGHPRCRISIRKFLASVPRALRVHQRARLVCSHRTDHTFVYGARAHSAIASAKERHLARADSVA